MILLRQAFILAIGIVALAAAMTGREARAQNVRTSALLLRMADENKSKWSSSMYYGVNSDFADNRDPRGYTHSLGVSVGYEFMKGFSTDASLGMRAETIGGQIEKDPDKSYAETLAVNPSTSLSLSYSGDLWIEPHTFSVSGFVEPLFDEASQREGYKAVAGTSAGLSLKFFESRWIMSQTVNWGSIVNTYTYGSNLQANPDYYYGYNLSNSFRLWKALKFSYTWGIRYTRYLDDYLSYAYSNSYGLSYAFGSLMTSLNYSAGGFTEDGEVSLWFIDDYRRVISLSLAYSF
jgi:hypothetical protein